MLLWDFLGTPVRVCWFVAVLITVGCTFDLAPLEEAEPDAAAGGSGGSGGPTQDGGVPLGGSAGAGAGGTGATGAGGTGSGGGFGGTGATGAGGSGAGGTGATGGGGSGAGGTGGGGGFVCANIAQLSFSCLEPSQTFCECQSCYSVCEDPQDGYPLSDCVCPSCWGALACDFCDKNGLCDPLGEGCGCIDCAGHPNCVGY